VSDTGDRADADAQVERFAALVALPAGERAAALAALAISDGERAELAQLLAADDAPDAALGAGIARSAARTLRTTPVAGRLGPWRLLREIGAGGMGTVFLAERADGTFEQTVAIKLLRGFPTQDGRRRLRQERQLLAQLDHPYIAHLIDGGETDDGQPFLVMEHVEGLPVPAFAATAQLDRAGRIRLIDGIAQALAHAHQRLVVHRDLKPSNVLVRADGTPRLLDFGVAKLVDLGSSVGATSTRVGTPGYASPEQRLGGAVTTATDVYALGVLMRELLTGRTPLGTPCRPPLAAVAVDADLGGIIAKATSDDPADRYPTMEALRDDIGRWQAGRPVRAARNTAWYRTGKFVARHRAGVAAATLAVLVVAAFVWRLGVERDRAELARGLEAQQRQAAEQAAQTAQATLDFFGGLLAELSPDGNIDAPITLRRMLERGSDRIDRELPEGAPQTPLVNTYLGAIYVLLGEPADAEARLRAGLDAMIRQGHDHGPTFGRAARDYATVLVELGRLPESSDWLQRSAQAYRAGPGPGSAAEAAGSDIQAHIFAERFEQAEQAARAALERAHADGAPAEAIATLDIQLAVALNAQSRSEQAQAAAVAALARLDAVGLGRSMFVYQLEQELGRAQLRLARPAQALASFDRARAVYVQGRGEAGFLLIVLDEWRTTALQALGRLSDARRLVEATQARWAAAAGRPPDALSRHGLAWAYAVEGDLASAQDLVRRNLADGPGFAGLTAMQARHVRLASARILGLAGSHADAVALMQAELKGAAKPGRPGDLQRWRLYLGESALVAGDWPQARREIGRAEKAIKAGADPMPDWHLELSRVRGRLALAQGRLDDAERDLAPLPGLHEASPAYRRAIAALDLAALRDAQGRRDEATALVRDQLPVLRASVLPTHPDRQRAERLAERLDTAVTATVD
jgi:serine/threonine-protein kinase